MMKDPDRIETARLLLRRPSNDDAAAILARYAGDAEVTRFMSWPRHRSIEDTYAFLQMAHDGWERWPADAYLIESRQEPKLLGGTGLRFETPNTAITGYVLARDAWGQGYATEALSAM